MGTTASALVFCRKGRATVRSGGDSRVYRLRDGVLEQATSTPPLVWEMQESGQIRSDSPRWAKSIRRKKRDHRLARPRAPQSWPTSKARSNCIGRSVSAVQRRVDGIDRGRGSRRCLNGAVFCRSKRSRPCSLIWRTCVAVPDNITVDRGVDVKRGEPMVAVSGGVEKPSERRWRAAVSMEQRLQSSRTVIGRLTGILFGPVAIRVLPIAAVWGRIRLWVRVGRRLRSYLG